MIYDGFIDAYPMPDHEDELWLILWGIVEEARLDVREIHCVLEKVHQRPDQSAQSGFTFGTGYGMILGQLAAANHRHPVSRELVVPQKWMKALNVPSAPQRKTAKGKLVRDGTQHKKNLIAIARRLYPRAKVWHENLTYQYGVADAILIAHYCKLRNR